MGVGRVWTGGSSSSHAPPQPQSLPPGQVRNSQFWDPQGLQTLFLEMLFKLMNQGFLPHRVVQEVMR